MNLETYSTPNIMMNSFDPYDALIDLSERLQRLERAHNKLVDLHKKTDFDLTLALTSLRNLQHQHLLVIKQLDESRLR